MKILLTNRYTAAPLDIIKKVVPNKFELIMLEKLSQEELTKIICKADYLLASGRLKISDEVLKNASKLKMIQRTGVGLDTLDLESIKRKKIPLYVNYGVNAESVAEHALLLMLAGLRRLPVIDRNTKNLMWSKQEQGVETHELKEKIVGLIGMGSVARALVNLLKPFRVKIFYHDLTRVEENFERKYNMSFVDLDELVEKSDIITIHCALTDSTRNLINAEIIKKMKDNVIIINTARGAIININDLAVAIKDGKISFAGIDVFEEEPFPASYPLLGLENVILTPHIGGITYEAFHRMMYEAMRNIEYFNKGQLDDIASYRYL